MNRRMVLLLGVGTLCAAPRTSFAQLLTPTAAAQGVIGLYGAISTQRFQNTTIQKLDEILDQLGRVRQQLDDILDLLKAMPEQFRVALAEDYRRQLADNIAARESTIFTRVASLQGANPIPVDAQVALDRLADDQATVRAQLGNIAPAAYPVVARAFATEAIALKAGGDRAALFNLRRDETAEFMRRASAGYERLATEQRAIIAQAEQVWERAKRPFYLGMFGGGNATHGRAIYALVRGDVSEGLRAAIWTESQQSNRVDPLGIGSDAIIPAIWLRAEPGLIERQMSTLRDRLATAAADGRQAAKRAGELDEHAAATSAISAAIRAMTY